MPCSFAYKIVCINNRLAKPTIIYMSKNSAYRLIKAILEEYKYCKKIMKKHFNKNLIMTEEEENLFQKSKKFVKNLLVMMKIKLEIIFT